MSTICSKIDSIDRLWFEPLPTEACGVTKICRIENTVVALGTNGKIYTNAAIARVAYSGGHDGRLSQILDGCIKLGVLTAKAVKQHKDDSAARQAKRDHKFNVEQLKAYTERLGIELSEDQLKKIGATE